MFFNGHENLAANKLPRYIVHGNLQISSFPASVKSCKCSIGPPTKSGSRHVRNTFHCVRAVWVSASICRCGATGYLPAVPISLDTPVEVDAGAQCLVSISPRFHQFNLYQSPSRKGYILAASVTNHHVMG